MDPEIRDILQRAAQAGRPAYHQGTPAQARAMPMLMTLLAGPAPQVARTEDLQLPARDGTRLGARLYLPSEAPPGLLVYFHGGGWVLGSVETFHPFTAALARDTGCAVLSVDYRLAPEHPYPGPVHDAVDALAFAAGTLAGRLPAGPRRLVAMGDSAGATLATVAARLHNRDARGNGARPVDLQVLAYPVTDADFDTASYQAFGQGHLLGRADMQWFWSLYCPDPAMRREPEASPLRAGDLAGSPPALLLAAGLDPLRDEGRAYAGRLAAAGVPTELVEAEGLVHGFLAMTRVAPSAGRAYQRILQAIAACLHDTPPKEHT